MTRPKKSNRVVKTVTLSPKAVERLQELSNKWSLPTGYTLDKIIEGYNEKEE